MANTDGPRRARPLVLLAVIVLAGCSTPNAPWMPLPQRPSSASSGPPALGFDGTESLALDRDRIGPETSLGLAQFGVALPFGALIAAAVLLALLHRRRARVDAAFEPRAPLADGPAVIVGVIEPDPDVQGPVVQLAIHQQGREWSHKGQWSHQWREVRRDVNARPFVLLRDDGTRVRVEPDHDVRLIDDHGRIVRHSLASRTRFAELLAGERVYATGVLADARSGSGPAFGAYRGMVAMPVLRKSRTGRLVLSTEPPGQTSRQRMKHHARWAAALMALVVAIAALMMPTFTLLAATGETLWVVPTAVRTWQEWHKPKNSRGYWVTRFALRAEYVDDEGTPHVLEDGAGAPYFQCAIDGSCPRVPFEVSSVAPEWHQLGMGPSLTIGRAMIGIIVTLIFAIAYPVSAFASRPWHMKSRVVDGGRGRLTL